MAVGREGPVAVDEQLHGQRRRADVLEAQLPRKLGPHILASATKRFDRLVELSVSWYLEGRLPAGEDVELGLTEDAVAIVGISSAVPDDIRRKVAQEAARLRAKEAEEKQQPS
jgi:basic membrane lipoprotein Med (substrate-binding protein (PBP1-ABC) superfamily)